MSSKPENSTPDARPAPGGADLPKKIGKYDIRGLAGQGNMGTVYIGRDTEEDRDVAVKVCHLPDDQSTNQRRLMRKAFYNEAHCAWVLRHPNILNIYDSGEDNGEPFIVMEYVDGGQTLKAHTSKDTLLPVATALKILYKCAKALDYAHRKGIIHRDIKPANIMLTQSAEVKIADFGIAYNAGAVSTQIMRFAGTLCYMSPEQIQEDTLTSCTDIYSLGVVAFELLTGQRPYNATSISRLAHRILEEPSPSIQSLCPELPDALSAVVERAMHKLPERRHESGQELAADLVSVFGELGGSTPINGTATRDLANTRKFELARKIDFFREFSNAELKEAVQACHGQCFKKGETIVWEGSDDRAVFIIAEGTVNVSISGGSIGVLGTGACFGEINFLSRRTRTATVTSRANVYVLKTDPEMIGGTGASCQLRFNQALTQVLLERLTQTSDRLAQLVQMSEMH